MSLHAFLPQQNRPFASCITAWLPLGDLRSSCTETVSTVERETGLEPATACLKGRWSQDHRLLDTKSRGSGKGNVEVIKKLWCPVPIIAAHLLGKQEVNGLVVGLPALLWASSINFPVPETEHEYVATIQQQPRVNQPDPINISFQGQDQVPYPHRQCQGHNHEQNYGPNAEPDRRNSASGHCGEHEWE